MPNRIASCVFPGTERDALKSHLIVLPVEGVFRLDYKPCSRDIFGALNVFTAFSGPASPAGRRTPFMKIKVAMCVGVASLISTVAAAQQVSVNYNHNQSFAQYHTYAWGSDNANQVQNSILAQVAKQDINSALQGKGLRMVQENQNPDLIVTGNGGMKQQTSYSAWSMRGIGGGMGGITPEQSVEGTLIVDLYEAKTQSLVWRGIAQNTLNKNGNKNQQMVEKAIQKMFKQWPK